MTLIIINHPKIVLYFCIWTKDFQASGLDQVRRLTAATAAITLISLINVTSRLPIPPYTTVNDLPNQFAFVRLGKKVMWEVSHKYTSYQTLVKRPIE